MTLLKNSINYKNINDVLEEFKNHRSVYSIRQTFMNGEKFFQKHITEDIVRKKEIRKKLQ